MREQVIQLLKEFKDVFAWTYAQMLGLDTQLVTHKLNQRRVQTNKVGSEELQTGARSTNQRGDSEAVGRWLFKPIQHPTWLANIVPVKKKNGQIRCCICFRDLNKAYPKNEFPLPNIDMLVDTTTGYSVFSFMYSFSGYNQIRMDAKDAEKTAFRTPIGNFHYTVMPFGLKNAGATYQRAMTVIFHDMMHDCLEDYVDDVVVKSKESSQHVNDLRRVFIRCREYNLKMNPLKCAFGVSSEKFLRFVVHHKGIDIDPTKAKAIQDMNPPKTVKN